LGLGNFLQESYKIYIEPSRKSHGVSALETKTRGINAITLDLWETLLFEKDGDSERRTLARCQDLRRALDRLGVKFSLEQVQSALEETTFSLLNIWKTNRDITHLDQIRLILKFASKGSITVKEQWVDELASAYIAPIFEVPPYLNPDARSVLRWLKGHGRSVGLICNTGFTPGVALRKFLVREGVAEFFDVMLFSDEVGIRKPDARIFQLAAQQLGSDPSEIVHVGDNLRLDVWGAKNAGFMAIYLLSEEGRDRIAESNPSSLVSLSRDLGNLTRDHIIPDKTVNSLGMIIGVIQGLEAQR
jgi:putative hydrolase of the HAD superfamily